MSTKHAVHKHHAHFKTLNYCPTGAAAQLLGSITTLFLHPKTEEITRPHLIGKKFMCKFPSGQIYYESKLDLCTDGSVFSQQDGTGQMETATKNVDGSSLDANAINYIVLPGGFYAHHKISKGDIAVVVYGNRKAYACFGDVGPHVKLGEGSIALHRELGHETIVHGHLKNVGITSGVITIVFPGSGNGYGRTNSESNAIGEQLFQTLQREGSSIGDFDPSSRTSSYA